VTEVFYDFTQSHQENAGVMSCAIFGLVGLTSIYFYVFPTATLLLI